MPNTPRLPIVVFAAAGFVLSLSAVVSNRDLDDWPQWRGANRDGISAERGLLKTWPAAGPPLAWQATGAGDGYSSFSSSHGRLYTLGARGGTEYVIAYDAATGKKLWEVAHGRRFGNDRGDGPRATPTVDGDRLYAFGASGDLARARRRDRQGLLEGQRAREVRRLEHPLGPERIAARVDRSDSRQSGGRGASIVALKKTDGSVIWKSLDDEPGYSSAVLHEAGGIRQAIYFTGERAVGVDVADGQAALELRPGREQHREHRHADRPRQSGVPLVRLRHRRRAARADDRGTIVHGARGLFHAGHAQPPRELGADRRPPLRVLDAILTAMQFDTGEVAWRDRSVGKGSLVFADDRLYLYSEQRRGRPGRGNPTAYREHGRFQIQSGNLPTWSHPVVSNGKLFLRDQDTIYAYDVRRK